MGGQPVASSRSSRPHRSSAATAGGCRRCVDIVSLGNVALSTSRTRRPARARSIARGDPAQRDPTTITSYVVVMARRYGRAAPPTIGSSPHAVSPCSIANSAAPARVETPIFP